MTNSRYEQRAARMTLLVSFFFFILLLALFRLQIIEGGYYRSLSEKNRLRIIELEGPRGRILDRNGKIIATNRISFNCTAVKREKASIIQSSFVRLAAILGQSVDELENKYKKRKAGVYQTLVLAEDISLEQAIAIEEQQSLMNGIMIETKPIRMYPSKESVAHLTGYIGPLREGEYLELQDSGYGANDWIGRQGLENSYESYLKGRSGGLQLEVNSRGQFLKVLGVQEPKEGLDLQLSIDLDLQEHVHDQFEGRRGAAAVMDLETGGLLCLNSSPSYDANLFSQSQGRKYVGKYLHDSFSPMLNRAIQGQYPPGSIYKIITALAALEERKINTQTSFDCSGFVMAGDKRFGCWKKEGHGPQNMYDAFAHSCDVFFYRTGLLIGVEEIYQKSIEFGLGARAGIDVPGERLGIVPNKSWKNKKKKLAWFDGDTLNLSIGQGYLELTPLQALGMIAAYASDGIKTKPYLVEKIDGQVVSAKIKTKVQITPEYLTAIKQGLDDVVNTSTGTGRLAKMPDIRIAGKTGTAQTYKAEDHAWYVGYAPADKPKIAFVIFLEFGGHGGIEAAQMANSVLLKLKALKYL